MNNCSKQPYINRPEINDRADYESLVTKYYAQVLAVCLGILNNIHDAEDVAQEAMLKGYQKMSSRIQQEQFRPWILRVARNLCIDHLRKKKRRQPVVEEQSTPSQQDADTMYDLQQAIGQLDKELRVPLLMYYFDGRNARNIAENLNVSHASVCQRLRKARRQLHDLMVERTEK